MSASSNDNQIASYPSLPISISIRRFVDDIGHTRYEINVNNAPDAASAAAAMKEVEQLLGLTSDKKD